MSSLALVRPRFVDLVVLALGAAALGACTGSAPPASSGGAAGSGGAPSAADGGAEVGGQAGVAGVTASATGGTTNAVHTEVPGPGGPPGVYLTVDTAKGSFGSCATTTLGDVLAAIRAADPTLADIGTIYNPATATSDGSFIYAYDVGYLGFDVVFKRGLGDCAAGCTENDYEYYSTDSTDSPCRPVHVGHYHTAWGTGTCLTVDGAPLWTHPMPPDPVTVCGQDNSARDLRGTYGLRGMGQRTPCSANAGNASAVDVTMKVVITQNPPELATGTVTFWYTGDPLVDGAPLPATFARSRFTATRVGSNLPNVCPSQATVTAHYDFEGYQPGGLEAVDFGDAACVACKGSLGLALSLAGDVNIP
jgi:hypothetical protein